MTGLTLRLHKMIDARDNILNNEKAMLFLINFDQWRYNLFFTQQMKNHIPLF